MPLKTTLCRSNWDWDLNNFASGFQLLLDFSMFEDKPARVIQGSVCSFTLVFCNYPDFGLRSIFAANS